MTMTPHSTCTSYLILGGARSGKSSYAETIAKNCKNVDGTAKDVVYIATANKLDQEMEQRVECHQNDRPSHWETIEEPLSLAKAIQRNVSPDKVILVDCLTMWLNNLLMQEDQALLEYQLEKFQRYLSILSGTVIFVSNEVGMGVVPMGAITRQFVDESGRLHQQLAQCVDNVILMTAGLPQALKGKLPTI